MAGSDRDQTTGHVTGQEPQTDAALREKTPSEVTASQTTDAAPLFGEAGSCCATCAHWSEDDDDDGRGCCAFLLNDPAARGWRTEPGYLCVKWRFAHGE